MLINKDYENLTRWSLRSTMKMPRERERFFAGPVTRITFGKEQHQWHSAMRNSYADPDGPAAQSLLPAGTDHFTLPAASMTVLRGRVE